MLRDLVDEDPSFSFSIDPESGLVILKGLSLDHLEQKACALVNERALSVNFGSPHVAYRETLGRRTEIDYTHKKQTCLSRS
jgi:elongation factor G